jgi:AcrR family transcriptional regulator
MAHRAGLDHATVVEAAARLVDEEGIEQLTLGRLAERLGVRTPSLYNHVAGLPGLKHDLALYCLRDVYDRVTRATIGKSRAEAIFAFADVYLAYARTTPGRYSLTLAPDLDDQEVQMLAARLVAAAQAILAPYKLSAEDSIHAVRSMRSIVHGFIILEKSSGFRMPVDRDASFRWLITLFIEGLSNDKR